jgi:hypothetical protein
MADAFPVEAQRIGLEAIWRKYRAQAATSRRLKQEQGQWRRVLLVATIVALVATPLAKTFETLHCPVVAKVWIAVATILFALTAWLNKEVLGDDSAQPWVRARQTAEGIKAVAFRFLMGAPPFEAAGEIQPALDRADELASKVQAADIVNDEQAKKNIPAVPLTADEYIVARLDDQIGFYEKGAEDERQIDTRIRKVSLVVSAGIAVFGALGALIAKEWRDIWAPALAMASTTVTTQLTRARHRYLIESYTGAAAKLRTVKAIWPGSRASPAETVTMVTAVEAIVANENAGWVQQMLLKPVVPDQARPATKTAGA